MGYDAVPAYFGGSRSLLDVWAARAQTRCGLTSPSPYFRDFLEDLSDQPDNSGTGSQSVQTTKGGVLLVQSGASASGVGGRILGYNLNNSIAHADFGSSSVFYLAARMKVTTAVDAQTIAAFYGSRTADGPKIGVVGSVSTTKFVAGTFQSGGSLTSNVDIDTNWHTFEVWRYNSVTYLAIDDVLQASGNCYNTAGGPLAIYVTNGTTAANRGLSVDAVFCSVDRSTS